MQKNKTPIKLFVLAFAVMAAVMIYQNLSRRNTIALLVKDNKGTSFLETVGDSLVCVFQDGTACVWDWAGEYAEKGRFKAASERTIVVGPGQLAAVTPTGKKMLEFYTLPSGEKQKELSIGWEDQTVWPRISFDKSAAALVRASPPSASGEQLYEFLTLDLDKDIQGLPVPLSINKKTETFVDFAVDSGHSLYAVGSRDKVGRIAAINLKDGTTLWDRVFDDTKEFCSVVVSPDGQYLLAGNRDGVLYKIDPASGEIIKKVVLLEPGETRPVTNDYSVLNLAFSPNGRFYVATINPPAYVLEAGSDVVVHKLSPANKLVSKIAFSPDGRRIATSDIRASYPIKILKVPQKKSDD
ncbi:MAG: WD40 repeat domain-containing protein [Planctomycetaceae bacterium]|nr:WD40 repeat domain-containing protein [Planctomycetaceae bacterium]